MSDCSEANRDRRRRYIQLPWPKKVAFALVPMVLIGIVGELALRADPYERTGTSRADFIVPDKDLMWRLQAVENGPLMINELGHRDTPHNPAAEVKILLLGDSVSFGDGIDDLRQCFPYQLEQRLNAPEATCEVINSGVPGYSTFQQAAYLVVPDESCLMLWDLGWLCVWWRLESQAIEC